MFDETDVFLPPSELGELQTGERPQRRRAETHGQITDDSKVRDKTLTHKHTFCLSLHSFKLFILHGAQISESSSCGSGVDAHSELVCRVTRGFYGGFDRHVHHTLMFYGKSDMKIVCFMENSSMWVWNNVTVDE